MQIYISACLRYHEAKADPTQMRAESGIAAVDKQHPIEWQEKSEACSSDSCQNAYAQQRSRNKRSRVPQAWER